MQNTVKKPPKYLVHAFMSHLCLMITIIAVFYLSWKMYIGDVWGALSMLLGYHIPSILCTFNSDIHFRSYAVARIGVFVLPTLTSFTQLDQGIWVASLAWIHVLWHIVHSILHPKHSWKSGRPSTKRWHGLLTKSPLSYVAFDLIGNIHDGMLESCFPILYTHYSTPSMVLKVWNHLIQEVMSLTPPQTLYQIQAEYWWSDFRTMFPHLKYIIYHHPKVSDWL